MNEIINIEHIEDNLTDTKENLNIEDRLVIEAMKKIKEPFKSLTVEDVMKDLKIGIVKAYEIFNRNDFPSINVGKTKTVTMLSYLIWKMKRQENDERSIKNGNK